MRQLRFQGVQQVLRAQLAVGRLVMPVEEGPLLGVDQPGAAVGCELRRARETEIRVSSMCISYQRAFAAGSAEAASTRVGVASWVRSMVKVTCVTDRLLMTPSSCR